MRFPNACSLAREIDFCSSSARSNPEVFCSISAKFTSKDFILDHIVSDTELSRQKLDLPGLRLAAATHCFYFCTQKLLQGKGDDET